MERRSGIWIALGITVVLLASLGHAGFYHQLTKKKYNLLEMQLRYREIQEQQTRLRVRNERLTSPERIEKLARDHLKLHELRHFEILRPETGQVGAPANHLAKNRYEASRDHAGTTRR